jgi:hypothetical protein
LVASFAVSFERFALRRLTYIPGNVKLWECPGRAGGLPVIIILKGDGKKEAQRRYFINKG